MAMGRIWFSIQLLSTGSCPSPAKRVEADSSDLSNRRAMAPPSMTAGSDQLGPATSDEETMTPETHPTSAPSSTRFDLYALVHKGLRAFMCHTLIEFGRIDPHDAPQLKSALDGLDQLLGYIESHLDKEEHFVHRAAQARCPGALTDSEEDHRHHHQAMEVLRSESLAVACASGPTRGAALERLYGALTRFVARDLDHLADEESHNNTLLWSLFSDAELADIHHSMVQATSQADMAIGARWILPSVRPEERDVLLAGVQATVPAPMFIGLLDLVRPNFPVQEQHRLATLFGQSALEAGYGSAVDTAWRFAEACFVQFDAQAAATLVADDFVAHPWTALGVPPGPAGIPPVVSAFGNAFVDTSLVLEQSWVAGEHVVLRYRYAGRHSGDLFGIAPTQRRFEIGGIAIMRIASGKLAELWREEDMLGLQRQLGVSLLAPEHEHA